ncbi:MULTISPECIES: YdcF family protein [unclassified Bosea (in: a-proteobacteria)]|uniref:YdcF family protein n=1 Tax=unclassified Bosea (in: a-proteobacteria) TaxID=2653178 RepID=UPI0009708689|nr:MULTISPECIES: YdcF family protein [unclassified Bosea (in: a-proteobacteria)]
MPRYASNVMVMIGSGNDRLSARMAGEPSRKERPSWGRLFGRAMLVALAAAAIGTGWDYVRFVGGIEAREPVATPRTDAIVVVTGGSQRVGDAIGLLGADRGARLLISGVNEKTSREELARLNPAARDLLACCVDLDYRARNTIGNAIETRRWVRQHRFQSLLVVTSNYHMPRTLAEFAHAMPGVRLVAHPVVTDQLDSTGWWRRWATVKVLVPEYVKFRVSRLRSLFESDPESSRLSVIIGGRKPVSPKPPDAIGPEAEKRSHLRGGSPPQG